MVERVYIKPVFLSSNRMYHLNHINKLYKNPAHFRTGFHVSNTSRYSRKYIVLHSLGHDREAGGPNLYSLVSS